MTDHASEQWATGPQMPQMGYTPPRSEPLAPVLLAIAPPARQARVTVLFRGLLAIPHYIVVWALGVAASVLVIIGWFAALFTGELPDFAADFLTGYLRWYVRLFAYTMLLTDDYPPFAIGDADYPVRIALRPGGLNNLAVLFRFFLMLPAGILAALLNSAAMTVLGFVSWLVTLVAGRLPSALHQAQSAVLRYSMRYLGFAYMLTSAYPSGLFGDKPAPTVPDDLGITDTQPAAGPPAPWLLVLSRAAKSLLVVYIVIGALVFACIVIIDVAFTSAGVNAFANAAALNTIKSELGPTNTALDAYPSKAQACDQHLSCLTALNRSTGSVIATFASELNSVTVSGSRASTALSALESAATSAADAFAASGATTTASQYDSDEPSLENAVTKFSTALNNMNPALVPGSSS